MNVLLDGDGFLRLEEDMAVDDAKLAIGFDWNGAVCLKAIALRILTPLRYGLAAWLNPRPTHVAVDAHCALAIHDFSAFEQRIARYLHPPECGLKHLFELEPIGVEHQRIDFNAAYEFAPSEDELRDTVFTLATGVFAIEAHL